MQTFRHLFLGNVCFWMLAVGAGRLRADGPPAPLHLVPEQANLFVHVPRPGQWIDDYSAADWFKQLQGLDGVREFYASTNARRLSQLVAHYEKQLGVSWPQAVERLAGGGIVFAVKTGHDPAPALLVFQGSDRDFLERFMKISLDLLEKELERQESKDRPRTAKYRDVETIHVGKDFHAAVAGSALLVSNRAEALQRSLDLHLDGPAKSIGKNARQIEARGLLPPTPLAWFWANLEALPKRPRTKEERALPFFVGAWLDLVTRAPFVCGGLFRRDASLSLTVRLPSGREGMNELLQTQLPPLGQPGILPLLEPRGVLYSTSHFMDLAKLWDKRSELLDDKERKDVEELDKKSSYFLFGNRFSKLLAQSGNHVRFVVANQPAVGYKPQPAQRIPAFALVLDLRAPEAFAATMESILRSAALFASTQVKLKLVEEKHGDCTIVGYRFLEDGKLKQDVNNNRFNFSPCFMTAKDQFVFCSTLELCRELLGLLQKEESVRPRLAVSAEQKSAVPTMRTQFYAAGGAEALRLIEDQLLAQTILHQGLSPDEAQKQVELFVALVRRLGILRIETFYGMNDFRLDVRLVPEK